MIKTMLRDSASGEILWGGEELIAAWAENADTWIWADFENEDPVREEELFRTAFGLHPLVIADAQRERHPPKLELFDEYFVLLVHGLDAMTTDIDFKTIPIALFVGKRFLVTRRKAASINIDSVWAGVDKGGIDVSRGPVHVAYRILRRMTDRYTTLVEGPERGIEDMEEEMFANPRDALLGELIDFGRNTKRLRCFPIVSCLARRSETLLSKKAEITVSRVPPCI